MTNLTGEFADKCVQNYRGFRLNAGEKVSRGLHSSLGRVLGPKKTEDTVNALASSYGKVEDATAAGYDYSARWLKLFGQKIASPALKEAFETVKATCHVCEDLAAKAREGAAYNKKELDELVSTVKSFSL